ncbi:WD40-repeat-containing domain protein [Gaertneriomyces semiglobifer]|nr:WD40-repeat-containing domain protein [Gaertneriomyces semiglobifer]
MAAMSGRTFTPWEERSFPHPVNDVVWCPNKDLVAVLHKPDELQLYRIPWEHVCTVQIVAPGVRINAICWRPDGKVIATGCENGSVYLYDVETGKLLEVLRGFGTAVISLWWFRWDPQSLADDNYEDEEDPLRIPLPKFDVATSPSLESYSLLNDEKPQLEVMCVVDDTLRMHLRL